MTMKQLRRAFSKSFFFCGLVVSLAATETTQATKELELFKDFDQAATSLHGGSGARQYPGGLSNDTDMEAIIQALLADVMRHQQEIGQQHLRSLPEDTRALVNQVLDDKNTLTSTLRLQNTVGNLTEVIRAQTVQSEKLKQALASLNIALYDGTFFSLFFTNISNNPDDKKHPVVAAVWGKPEAEALLGLLQQAPGSEAAVLCDVIQKLTVTNYSGAARACYEINVPAIDALELQLKKVSAVLMQQAAMVAPGDVVLRNAFVHWTKQINKHLHTIINVKKAAAKATIDLSWLLYAVSHLYDIVAPYYELNAQPSAGFSTALVQDVFIRSGIALASLAQKNFDAAGRDITHCIMSDSSLVQFVDPLSEGIGLAGLLAISTNVQKYGTYLFAAGQAASNPAMYASKMSPLVRFGIRFSCAFAWYNLGNFKNLVTSYGADNQALSNPVYCAILRMGIFQLEGYVSGVIQKTIYEHVGADRVYAIENATMGIVSPHLLTELMDVCVTNFLMDRHPGIENYIAKFSDSDVYRYNSPWYLNHMANAYTENNPRGDNAGFSQFLRSNKKLYVEYSALYYLCGSMGRYWARKGAEANIDALASGLGKVSLKALSLVYAEEDLMMLSHSKEIIVSMLQAMVQDIMHTPGSQQRRSFIESMRWLGMLPAHVQDDKIINDVVVAAFIDICLFKGIFDYKQATVCHEEYKKQQDNLVEYVPFLVDKIGDGILITLSGVAGRYVGHRVAELFFRKPVSPPSPDGSGAAAVMLATA